MADWMTFWAGVGGRARRNADVEEMVWSKEKTSGWRPKGRLWANVLLHNDKDPSL